MSKWAEAGSGVRDGYSSRRHDATRIVVHPAPVLGEEHVPGHLAAEQDPILAHLALEEGVPGLPHDGLAAVGAHVLDQHLRALHVEDHLGAGVAARGGRARAGPGRDRPRGAGRARRRRPRDRRRRRTRGRGRPRSRGPGPRDPRMFSSISGSGRWWGKLPSDSQYSSVTSQPSRRSRSGAKLPAMPLPASTTTRSGRASAPCSRMAAKYSSRGSRVVRAPRARARSRAAPRPRQALDLVLGEGRRPGVHHLDAIVGHGVVAAGDGGAAVELPVRGGEVEEGRVVRPRCPRRRRRRRGHPPRTPP